MDYVNDIMTTIGAAYSRGGADYYYHRPFEPERHGITDPKEVEAYAQGYDDETFRKDWGD